MKIVIFSNLYPPNDRGGAEIVAQNMAFALRDLQHEVLVFTLGRENKNEILENITVFRNKIPNLYFYSDDAKQPYWKKFIWHAWDIFNIAAYLKIRKFLQQQKPDMAICHNLMGLGFLTIKAIKSLKIKCLYFSHDVQLADPSGLLYWQMKKNYVYEILKNIYAKICAWLFRGVDVVISPSSWLLKFYQEKDFWGNSRCLFLPNFYFTDQPSKKNKRSNKFLFIGQIEKHKGIDWLLDFWQKEFPDKILEIVGDGSLKNDLQKRFPNFLFHGKIAAQSILPNFDFLLMPTLVYENAPIVVPLAMSCGVPILVNDIGGAAELVEDKQNGFLLEPKNEIQLKKIIQKISDFSDEDYYRLSQNAQEKIKNFDKIEYLKKLKEIIANC